jgi:hypothetical protein
MHDIRHLSLMSLEVIVHTRVGYVPDPDCDRLFAVVYALTSDACAPLADSTNIRYGAIIVAPSTQWHRSTIAGWHDLIVVDNECQLFAQIVTIVQRYGAFYILITYLLLVVKIPI